jgi:hypothetical protein
VRLSQQDGSEERQTGEWVGAKEVGGSWQSVEDGKALPLEKSNGNIPGFDGALKTTGCFRFHELEE